MEEWNSRQVPNMQPSKLILSNSPTKPSATSHKLFPDYSHFKEYSGGKKCPVLTTTRTVLPQPVTVQTDPKTTLPTNPMNIEECRLAYITHLPHTTYGSLPCHLLYREKAHYELLLWHFAFLPPNLRISQQHDLKAEYRKT